MRNKGTKGTPRIYFRRTVLAFSKAKSPVESRLRLLNIVNVFNMRLIIGVLLSWYNECLHTRHQPGYADIVVFRNTLEIYLTEHLFLFAESVVVLTSAVGRSGYRYAQTVCRSGRGCACA